MYYDVFICAVGVEREIFSSSSFMSAPTSANSGVGQHAEDVRSRGSFGGDLQRARECRARGDADEDAFFRRQLLGAADRFRPRNRDQAVDQLHRHRVARDLRNEIGRPALHRVRLEARMRRGRRAVGIALLLDAAAEQLRVFRLAGDDLGVGALLAQHARDTL